MPRRWPSPAPPTPAAEMPTLGVPSVLPLQPLAPPLGCRWCRRIPRTCCRDGAAPTPSSASPTVADAMPLGVLVPAVEDKGAREPRTPLLRPALTYVILRLTPFDLRLCSLPRWVAVG